VSRWRSDAFGASPIRRLAIALSMLLAWGVGPTQAGAPVLDLATDRAVSYEDAALRWTCDEIVRRVHYRDGGSSTESRGTTYAILLVRDPMEHHAVEQIAPADTPDHPLSHPPSALRGYPPVTSWLRLFHPDTRPWMLIRDSGPDRPDPSGHAFTFRGAASLASGDDLREWEGTAWVDPITGDLLKIAAIPTVQSDRLAKLIARRNIWGFPIDVFGVRFNIGPKAHGRRVEIAFGPTARGFWLPSNARLEEFDAVSLHEERPVRATLVSLERCREFETRSTHGPTKGNDQRSPR